MPIPTEKIVDRAKASGFDAELQVASILLRSGWSARQSVYYIDKDERKGRELDIVAHRAFISIKSKPEITCRIFLCIEVKRTQEPFIFFTSTPSKFEGGTGYGLLNWRKDVQPPLLPFKAIEKDRPLGDAERLARSYISFKDAKEQHIRSGVISAFKGAVHASESADETYSDTSHDICFYIPIVVVDGPLYECFFPEETSELAANEIDRIVYMQNYLSENYGEVTCRVNIISLAALEELVADYKSWGERMLASMVARRNVDETT